ncbi:MAG: glycosyltransferase [Victivallales bacterium]|nr:glycosyltransferase [Victivallales bacterium]
MLPRSLRGIGFDLMLKHWDLREVISALYVKYQHKVADLLPDLKNAQTLKPGGIDHPIKTIGIFYHSMSCGGVQRVISILTGYYADLGYEVVLFTDQAPHSDDYKFLNNVQRVVLPSANEDNYKQRSNVLLESLKKYRIDVMLYHAWVDPNLLWDMLLIKGSGIGFVVHAHSIFSFACVTMWDIFTYLPDIYSHADLVVTLSRVDELYYSAAGIRSKYLPNPISFDTQEIAGEKPTVPTLLWIGRISAEKRPLDAVRIFAEVVKRIPEARLLIVGEEHDGDRLTNQLTALIRKEELTDKVVLYGFQSDVEQFYHSSTLLLNTSVYEGFPMTFAEAFVCGLPIVTYEMPYLELLRINGGFEGVNQGSIEEAARTICEILSNSERLATLQFEAQSVGEWLRKNDLRRQWAQIFKQLEEGFQENSLQQYSKDDFQILFSTLRSCYHLGVVNAGNKLRHATRMEGGNTFINEQNSQVISPNNRQLTILLNRGVAKACSRFLFTGGRLLTAMIYSPRKTLRFLREMRTIAASRMFDKYYYLGGKDDLSNSWTIFPLYHFCFYGWFLGYDPSASFSLKDYIKHNPDVEASDCNPLVHYIKYGYKEGRRIR